MWVPTNPLARPRLAQRRTILKVIDYDRVWWRYDLDHERYDPDRENVMSPGGFRSWIRTHKAVLQEPTP